MTTTSLDLDDLKAKALAATPGPWTAGYGDGVTGPRTGASTWLDVADVKYVPVAAGGDAVAWIAEAAPGATELQQLQADAAFIAAANPATVLELIARLERAEAALADIAGAASNSTIRGLQQLAARAMPTPNDPLDDVLPLPARFDPTLLARIPQEVMGAAHVLTRWDAERGDGKGWRIDGICNEAWANEKNPGRAHIERFAHYHLGKPFTAPDSEGGHHD